MLLSALYTVFQLFPKVLFIYLVLSGFHDNTENPILLAPLKIKSPVLLIVTAGLYVVKAYIVLFVVLAVILTEPSILVAYCLPGRCISTSSDPTILNTVFLSFFKSIFTLLKVVIPPR